MSSFDVTVMFKGLCLFHLEPQARGKRVRVVLVNALQPRKARDGETVLAKHKPSLTFTPAHCTNLTSLPPADQTGTVDLKELSVKLGAAGDPTQVPMVPDIPWGTLPGGSWGPESQFQWIVPLEKLCRPIHSGPRLRRSCLEHPLPRNEYVISRVHLGSGILECARMAKDQNHEPIPWDFMDLKSDQNIWNQALSDWVKLTVSGLEEPFPVHLDRNGSQFRSILIDPRRDGSSVAKVSILNTPEEEPDVSHGLKHFLWFFELLDPPSEVNPFPVAKSTVHGLQALPNKPLSTTNAFCPPASWGG